WIIEGFAVFFESARWNGKDVDIGYVPRDRLDNLKRGIQANQYIPLPELIRTEHAAFGGYHYAHAWSVIYYMLYGGKTDKIRKHNQKIFSDLFFLAKTRLKPVTPDDVEALWGGKEKFAAWEEEWKKWVVELPYDFNPKDPDASREKEPAAPDDGAPRAPGTHASHYAPRAAAFLVDASALPAEIERLVERDEVVGVLARTVRRPAEHDGEWIDAPADAEGYARDLYANLRRLDAGNPDAILVESPPDDPAWLAVRDRLERATHKP
ncbi:MAG: Sua5 family C-terminal domain-containing protein, partial [Vicinamibacteria bacterium]